MTRELAVFVYQRRRRHGRVRLTWQEVSHNRERFVCTFASSNPICYHASPFCVAVQTAAPGRGRCRPRNVWDHQRACVNPRLRF